MRKRMFPLVGPVADAWAAAREVNQYSRGSRVAAVSDQRPKPGR